MWTLTGASSSDRLSIGDAHEVRNPDMGLSSNKIKFLDDLRRGSLELRSVRPEAAEGAVKSGRAGTIVSRET